jgi:hypothetical protein
MFDTYVQSIEQALLGLPRRHKQQRSNDAQPITTKVDNIMAKKKKAKKAKKKAKKSRR